MNDRISNEDLVRLTVLTLQRQLAEKDRQLVEKDAQLFTLHIQARYAGPGERVEVTSDGRIIRTPTAPPDVVPLAVVPEAPPRKRRGRPPKNGSHGRDSNPAHPEVGSSLP